MGMSFTVEAAKDQSYIREFSYRSIIQSSILIIPIISVILIASPTILSLFGSDYAAEGSKLLRLLALSALPYVITSLHISIARVQRRIINIVITMSALCGMVLLITFMLLGRLGLVGVGWAWLISQSVVAIVIALTSLRKILFFES
jgi:O-antigen/teichoic acid export membrane protein